MYGSVTDAKVLKYVKPYWTHCNIEWGKFYQNRVIKIWGVELSSQTCHLKNIIQKSYPKQFYPKTNMTYLALLYRQVLPGLVWFNGYLVWLID